MSSDHRMHVRRKIDEMLASVLSQSTKSDNPKDTNDFPVKVKEDYEKLTEGALKLLGALTILETTFNEIPEVVKLIQKSGNSLEMVQELATEGKKLLSDLHFADLDVSVIVERDKKEGE